jgi:hypothetical protein
MLWGGRRSFGKVQLVDPSRPKRVGRQSGHVANQRGLPIADLVVMDHDRCRYLSNQQKYTFIRQKFHRRFAKFAL